MTISMQKVNFTTHFLLKISQRSSRHVILGTLDMPGYTHQSDNIDLFNTFKFIYRQKSTSFPMFFWRYCKDMQTSYFG